MAIYTARALRALGIAGVAALALGHAGAASAEDTVRVGKGFAGSFGYAIVNVGVDAGIFAKAGLKLEITNFPGGAKLQQGLAADAVDVGFSGGTDMALTAKGAPMKAVTSVMVGVEQVAIVKPDSKFKTVDDLKGSSWMAPSKASMPGWLPVGLAIKKGWGKDGVVIQTGAPPDAAMALIKTGQLDAMTMDPTTAYGLEAKGEMRVLIKFKDYVDPFFQYAIFATDKFQKEKPEVLKKFVAAWLQTVAYAQANKDAAVKSISAAIGVDAAIVAKTYDATIKDYSADGKFPAAALEGLKTASVESGILDKAPDMKTLYTEEFLPKK